MIDLDDFLPDITPKAPGVSAPAAYAAILHAGAAICMRTREWRDSSTVPVMDLDDIEYEPPAQALLIDFESVLFGDADILLEPKAVAWMDRCMRGWRRGAIVGMPRYYTQLAHGNLRIAPLENGILTVNAILKPSADAEQVPDFLFEKYREVVAWGALARLLVTPNQPFTDLTMGPAYAAMFANKLDSLAWSGEFGEQRAVPRSRGNYM